MQPRAHGTYLGLFYTRSHTLDSLANGFGFRNVSGDDRLEMVASSGRDWIEPRSIELNPAAPESASLTEDNSNNHWTDRIVYIKYA
ncbi:hypothetical protein V1525DRAFT_390650 [Lipomyces kononenkoae]|uniref:Uncharacterized protein n=1 Tax=Lipomyces kononenkoae TaxID=34357 RepID=A0ACC3SUF6_LIPKO